MWVIILFLILGRIFFWRLRLLLGRLRVVLRLLGRLGIMLLWG
jgi:hypothetical protein